MGGGTNRRGFDVCDERFGALNQRVSMNLGKRRLSSDVKGALQCLPEHTVVIQCVRCHVNQGNHRYAAHKRIG